MNEAQQKKAVIYARVSSAQQTTRTDGLSSQEQRCRLYCEHKGYEVVEIFKDDMSGSVAKRPGMDAMLSYLRKTRKHSHDSLAGSKRIFNCELRSDRPARHLNRRPSNSAKTAIASSSKICWRVSVSTRGKRTRNKHSIE